MSASNAFELLLLNHIFQNANIANVGDATGLRGSSASGVLYISLHTSAPGEAGSQNTNEATYTGYARVAVPRNSGCWSNSANIARNLLQILFPEVIGNANTITHYGIGTASSGAGTLLFSGALTSSISASVGVSPIIDVQQLSITFD